MDDNNKNKKELPKTNDGASSSKKIEVKPKTNDEANIPKKVAARPKTNDAASTSKKVVVRPKTNDGASTSKKVADVEVNPKSMNRKPPLPQNTAPKKIVRKIVQNAIKIKPIRERPVIDDEVPGPSNQFKEIYLVPSKSSNSHDDTEITEPGQETTSPPTEIEFPFEIWVPNPVHFYDDYETFRQWQSSLPKNQEYEYIHFADKTVRVKKAISGNYTYIFEPDSSDSDEELPNIRYFTAEEQRNLELSDEVSDLMNAHILLEIQRELDDYISSHTPPDKMELLDPLIRPRFRPQTYEEFLKARASWDAKNRNRQRYGMRIKSMPVPTPRPIGSAGSSRSGRKRQKALNTESSLTLAALQAAKARMVKEASERELKKSTKKDNATKKDNPAKKDNQKK